KSSFFKWIERKCNRVRSELRHRHVNRPLPSNHDNAPLVAPVKTLQFHLHTITLSEAHSTVTLDYCGNCLHSPDILTFNIGNLRCITNSLASKTLEYQPSLANHQWIPKSSKYYAPITVAAFSVIAQYFTHRKVCAINLL